MTTWNKFLNTVLGFEFPSAEEIEDRMKMEEYLDDKRDEELESSQSQPQSQSQELEYLCYINFYIDKNGQTRFGAKWPPGTTNEDTAYILGQLLAQLTGGQLNEMIFKTLVSVGNTNPQMQSFMKEIITCWREEENISVDQPIIPAHSTIRKFAQESE